MTITPAELLILANQISGRAETDITNFLKNTVHDLERDSVFLEGTEEISLTTGTRSYAIPSNYRKPFHLQPKDATYYYDELEEISYDEYKTLLVNNTGNSKPLRFAVFNGYIYLDPPPSATYTKLDIWGKKEHGDTVTSISYPDKFRKLLSHGCAWEIYVRYGLTDEQKARDVKAIYDEEKQKFISRKANEKHHVTAYRDF